MTRRASRIYARDRGGERRYYADFRDFADAGGSQEALIAPGEKRATADRTVAEILLARRLEELEARRRGRVIHGIIKQATLGEFAALHLVAKKKAGRVTDETLMAAELHLRRAIDYFGAGRELGTIAVADVRGWMGQLQERSNGRGGSLTGWSARHHLGALSNLFRRAASEGYVPPGFNPAGALLEKPRAPRSEARWLEVDQAAVLLEAARTYRPKRGDVAIPFALELLATFLLTGGRCDEVLGLEVADVLFDRSTVTFRPNAWRRLKTEGSLRAVPLWPQLEAILRPYVFNTERPPAQLLFPSMRTGREAMLTDVRKMLDAIGAAAGWSDGEIRTKMFRHTYCAARLQTLDRGQPVSLYTVSRELGHGSTAMVQRVYAHLGQARHRSDVLEYIENAACDRECDREVKAETGWNARGGAQRAQGL